MNQEIPFDNYNTLHYAMHLHDIERIAQVETVDINENLRKGWVLLALFTQTEICWELPPFPVHTTAAYMGKPRPQYCSGNWSDDDLHPDNTQKTWNHDRKEWECRWCIEDDAYAENAIKGTWKA
jgi:hypothetical protein